MQETLAKARKLGGSLIVRIPKEIVEDENIHEGEMVRLRVSKVRKSGFGSLKGVGSMTREDELDEQIRY
jgi:antitoxin component of MazEF toxin-antitoxin module